MDSLAEMGAGGRDLRDEEAELGRNRESLGRRWGWGKKQVCQREGRLTCSMSAQECDIMTSLRLLYHPFVPSRAL